MNKFTVTYTDKTEFSGDPFAKDWLKIPDTQQIAKLEYVLGNSCITMQGFKQYNHLIECLGMMKKGISKVILMGRQDNKTLLVIFDIEKKNIYKQIKPHGKEYGVQILRGWKVGYFKDPKVYFRKIENVS